MDATTVGPPPTPQRTLAVETLADAIRRAASDPDMTRKAAELGDKIRSEDGVADAVAYILKYVEEHRRGAITTTGDRHGQAVDVRFSAPA